MHVDIPAAQSRHRSFKILVLDEDDRVANTLAYLLAPGSCEIISCRDMAVAEAATDLTEFDLIMAAPGSTGVGGLEGLAVADFLAQRNPTATTTLLVPEGDADLKAAADRRGSHGSLTPSAHALSSLLTQLGVPLTAAGQHSVGSC